jgi:DnaJ-class molecular chaperone
MSADEAPKLDGDPREFLRAARKAFERPKKCSWCGGAGYRLKNVYRNVYHGRHLFPFKTFIGSNKVPCKRCGGAGRIQRDGTHE